MAFITTRAVKHNGKLYAAGTYAGKISDLTEEQAQGLLASGALKDTKSDSSKD